MKESLVSSWQQHLVCKGFITGSDSYQGRNSRLNQVFICFLWRSGSKSNSRRTRKGSLFGQSLWGTTVQGKPKWGLHYCTALCNVLLQCKRQRERCGLSLYIMSFLTYFDWYCFCPKVASFYVSGACWERRTDFPAGPSTLKTWEHA